MIVFKHKTDQSPRSWGGHVQNVLMTGIPFLRGFVLFFSKAKRKFLKSTVLTGTAWFQKESEQRPAQFQEEQLGCKQGSRPKASTVPAGTFQLEQSDLRKESDQGQHSSIRKSPIPKKSWTKGQKITLRCF